MPKPGMSTTTDVVTRWLLGPQTLQGRFPVLGDGVARSVPGVGPMVGVAVVGSTLGDDDEAIVVEGPPVESATVDGKLEGTVEGGGLENLNSVVGLGELLGGKLSDGFPDGGSLAMMDGNVDVEGMVEGAVVVDGTIDGMEDCRGVGMSDGALLASPEGTLDTVGAWEEVMVGVAVGPDEVDGIRDVEGASVRKQARGGLELMTHTCSSIQSANALTRVYTPGKLAWPHLDPNETIPNNRSDPGPSSPTDTNGPPESP